MRSPPPPSTPPHSFHCGSKSKAGLDGGTENLPFSQVDFGYCFQIVTLRLCPMIEAVARGREEYPHQLNVKGM